tara:strand:- start:379 stop:879 length:501 start_codon:yes stop_codon:yes gene_type:complete
MTGYIDDTAKRTLSSGCYEVMVPYKWYEHLKDVLGKWESIQYSISKEFGAWYRNLQNGVFDESFRCDDMPFMTRWRRDKTMFNINYFLDCEVDEMEKRIDADSELSSYKDMTVGQFMSLTKEDFETRKRTMFIFWNLNQRKMDRDNNRQTMLSKLKDSAGVKEDDN